jgi:hypothetical protein
VRVTEPMNEVCVYRGRFRNVLCLHIFDRLGAVATASRTVARPPANQSIADLWRAKPRRSFGGRAVRGYFSTLRCGSAAAGSKTQRRPLGEEAGLETRRRRGRPPRMVFITIRGLQAQPDRLEGAAKACIH